MQTVQEADKSTNGRKRKYRWTSISQSVRLRVHGLFLILSFFFLLELMCPSVRGCLYCGMLINHRDGCKHMTASWRITTRYQVITAMHEYEDTAVRS